MPDNNDASGKTETAAPAIPFRIYADTLLQSERMSLSYAEKKDGWITRVALGVIAGSAVVSAFALLAPIFMSPICDESGCTTVVAPSWAPEMLRLSLVASLAFVMGTGGKSANE